MTEEITGVNKPEKKEGLNITVDDAEPLNKTGMRKRP